jgi:putative ABC transport system permease protein
MIPLRYNIRSLLVRRTTSLMTALGVALVVMILLILSGFIAGLRQTFVSAGVRGNYIVLARGVTSEAGSFISREQFELIRSRPEIVSDSSGEVLLSPEYMTGFMTNSAAGKPMGFTMLRGVYPIAQRVHRGMKLVSGRWPLRGQSEMVVGSKLAARFPNLNPPLQLRFGRRVWTIVGVFSDSGSARESEIWTDLDVLEQDIRYANGFAALHVRLKPGMEDSFKQALNNDQRLRVDAETEAEFYANESDLADQLRGLGLTIAIILGVGATFGGMNTMYAAVARRGKEVGVLRALGFTRRDVMLSFLAESILIGIAGGAIGLALGVLVASAIGLNSQLMNVDRFIFSFKLTAGAFVSGLIAGIAIGAIGGLLPALRASRAGVVDSLRAA